MDELIDFEELINLQLSLPSVSQSSQEPITDILDEMCEAMDESNLAVDNACKDKITADDDIVNLDDFENLLDTASICTNESNLVTDDLVEINDMVEIADDTIDLDEFESISANACLFIDNEDDIYNDNNDISNLQKCLSYEVLIEFEENAHGHKTESQVIKEENVTSTNNRVLQTISVEARATSGEKEIETNIDLTFEFGTVNPVSNKLKTVSKEYNGLEAVRECKIETNITENIVTLTTNSDSNVKYEHGIEISKTDCKNTIETFTEDNNENSNSDSDYDPLDFEFISEQQACKAGIVTRISKVTNKTKKTVNKTAPSTSNNAESKLQTHIQRNCTGQSTSNIDNRPRKNEASLADYVKYSKYRYQRCYARSASELHVIPEGERYLDMFRGEYAPGVVNNLYSLTNKRVLSSVAMAANFEEIAYRNPGMADEENEKYKGDADDCRQKILSAYPHVNRRKRRRY